MRPKPCSPRQAVIPSEWFRDLSAMAPAELATRFADKEYELRALWQLGVYLMNLGQPGSRNRAPREL